MSNSIQERLAADLQKAKVEGSVRASRLGAIVKDAATQAITEVKAGSGEIGAIAKETLSTVVANLGEPEGVPATETTPQTNRFKVLLFKLFQTMKARLSQQFQKEYTEVQQQVTQLKDRAANLDTNLTDRYGDRYTAAKQRLEDTGTSAGTWYANTRVEAEAQGIDPLQQQQAQVDIKAAEAGTFVARKEQQFRQQLKGLLQKPSTKL